jgi:three-Cys-motif partner protein
MPDDVLWELQPHSQAKHAILRRYLEAWFPILNKYHGRIMYFDGFAGPGQYKGGEPGSPIIALDVAANHRRRMRGEIGFCFVEADEKRFDHLQRLVAELDLPQNFQIYPLHAEFHEVLGNALVHLEQTGSALVPTFAFIDPFGFSGVPMGLIHRLLSHQRTEAFITFQVSFINRFLKHPDPQISAHVVDLFGTEEVLNVACGGGNRVDKLRYLYQSQLQQVACYIRFFSMHDQRDQPIYDLFFAGNHSLGHCRMKEAMWKVDEDGQFSFSDLTNPLQPVLFRVDHTAQLLDAICHQFEGRSSVLMDHIQAWVWDNTPFLDKHMRAALRAGEQEGRFLVHSIKRDGEKRRRGTFPPDVIIDFPNL